MAKYLTIAAHYPIISRDGRPFGPGQRMGSLDWIYPSVLAGSVRTALGNKANASYSDINTLKSLKEISISGPLPILDGRLFFPAPKDILVREDGDDDGENKIRHAYAIRPSKLNDGEGCDLPFSKCGLLPAMLPKEAKKEFKPAEIPAFWSRCKMVEWLVNPKGNGFSELPLPPKQEEMTVNSEFLPIPQKDYRIHTKIDRDLGSAEDEMLFKTAGLDLSLKRYAQGINLAVRVEANETFLNGKNADELDIDCFSTIGGERRLSRWSNEAHQTEWSFPSEEIKEALENQRTKHKQVRMVLATPSIFCNIADGGQGWLPGWLKLDGSALTGAPKEAPAGLKLKLVSACIDRWKPISGWSLEDRKQKPIRRLVPAGSVYFFEVLEGDAAALAESLWLRSVCDDPQDQRDGFGLALWGIWDYADENDANRQE